MIYLTNVNIANLINCDLVTKLKQNYVLEYDIYQEELNPANNIIVNLNTIYTPEFIADLHMVYYIRMDKLDQIK